ncbi:MAG TPA: methyltransferase domain-containing protein [Ktedonobacteraceae bacterium]|nr:methyltransferase domain-containing protein [Ktedonobacteraceae bacterium]
MPIILSYIQTRPLLEARKHGLTETETSLDLGMSTTSATLSDEGVSFATGECLDWASVEKISQSEVTCYAISAEGMQSVQTFSNHTNRLCSLLPTQGAPSVLIAGFSMHRIKEVDPWQHAQRMVAAIAPISGSVLDTTTGLGYTTILAARTAQNVTTIELDPGVQTIARCNPWSRELFANPNITQVMGDAYEVVPTIAAESFDRIMHDPPTLKLAGQLYAGTFYHELHRVLKRGGRIFHYIGDLNSKGGSVVTRGVMRRLQEAGFSRVVRRTEAYGVVAYK